MTDKELLELAAKAAGLNIKAVSVNADDDFDGLIVGEKYTKQKVKWNPITDDTDAFRLAVDLSLFDGIDERASALAAEVAFDMCPRAATRRAIVRAAAQLA